MMNTICRPPFLSRRSAVAGAVVAAVALGSAAEATEAQQLRYVTESRIEMGGMLGAMAGMMGDLTEPTIETTLIGDGVIRTDNDASSTIIRLGEGSMVQINHEEKSWYSFEFGDFGTMLDEMKTEAQAEASAAQAEALEMTGSFSMDRTDRRQSVNGYDAEQVFMTIELAAAESGTSPMGSGRMVMFIESWMSPALATHPAFQSMNEQARDFVRNGAEFGMGDMSAAMMGGDQMGEALQQFQEQLQSLEGMPVRTTSLFLMLPDGAEFDQAAALEALEADLSADGPSLSDLMAGGGGDAAREALGRFGFGGGSSDAEPEAPAQQTLMRLIQEVREIESVTLDPSTFQPPAEYREVASPMKGIGGR